MSLQKHWFGRRGTSCCADNKGVYPTSMVQMQDGVYRKIARELSFPKSSFLALKRPSFRDLSDFCFRSSVEVVRFERFCEFVFGNGTVKEDKRGEQSDSDDEVDPSQRRAALGEFRKRHRFTIPMHHQA